MLCVSAGRRDAVVGCGFALSAGTRMCGGGSGAKNDMSIPASMSSSSNSTHVVVSAREIGPNIDLSHSESVSVTSMTSRIALSRH